MILINSAPVWQHINLPKITNSETLCCNSQVAFDCLNIIIKNPENTLIFIGSKCNGEKYETLLYKVELVKQSNPSSFALYVGF